MLDNLDAASQRRPECRGRRHSVDRVPAAPAGFLEETKLLDRRARRGGHEAKPCRRTTTARSGEARERLSRGEIEVAVVAAESLREDVAKSVTPGKRSCIALDEIAPGDDDEGGVTESDTTRWYVSALGRRPARSEKYPGPADRTNRVSRRRTSRTRRQLAQATADRIVHTFR